MDHYRKFLNQSETLAFFKLLSEADWKMEYDFEKHQLTISKERGEAQLRLPITLNFDNEGFVPYPSNGKYIMVLVQTGSASIGVFSGGDCLEHKVLTAYMVRKKQGKSQIKHLKTKGKSRAGSRVRLAKTLEFFENINERLAKHFEEHEFERIAFSCSKILMPYLFKSKVVTPFDRKDARIYKIPKHLHQPNYDVMLGMQRFLNKGEIVFDEKQLPELKLMLDHL